MRGKQVFIITSHRDSHHSPIQHWDYEWENLVARTTVPFSDCILLREGGVLALLIQDSPRVMCPVPVSPVCSIHGVPKVWIHRPPSIRSRHFHLYEMHLVQGLCVECCAFLQQRDLILLFF